MTNTLPAPVSAFIETLNSASSPAFIQTDDRYQLLSAGGALERYSLDTVKIGASVTQQFPLLEGLLQHQQKVHFERVQLIKAHYVNVDVFTEAGDIWVLLTDTTMRCQVEQQVQQQRLGQALKREMRERKQAARPR